MLGTCVALEINVVRKFTLISNAKPQALDQFPRFMCQNVDIVYLDVVAGTLSTDFEIRLLYRNHYSLVCQILTVTPLAKIVAK